MKKVLLILSSVSVLLINASEKNNNTTVVVLENPVIDSLELVIDSMKVQFTKDRIFSKCRYNFFNETFEDRNSFIERLLTYKDSTFVLSCFEKLIQIKEKEKQLYNLVKNSTDDYNVRGWVRLHVKKTENQLSILNSFVMKYTKSDNFKLGHEDQQRLMFE